MDPAYSGIDRRRHKRLRVNFVVTYRVHRPLEVLIMFGNKEYNAFMLDLSEAGMSLLTECDIPSSTILSIQFTLINFNAAREKRAMTMRIAGEVCYNKRAYKKEHRLGISFTEIEEDERQAIASFVTTAFVGRDDG